MVEGNTKLTIEKKELKLSKEIISDTFKRYLESAMLWEMNPS